MYDGKISEESDGRGHVEMMNEDHMSTKDNIVCTPGEGKKRKTKLQMAK